MKSVLKLSSVFMAVLLSSKALASGSVHSKGVIKDFGIIKEVVSVTVNEETLKNNLRFHQCEFATLQIADQSNTLQTAHITIYNASGQERPDLCGSVDRLREASSKDGGVLKFEQASHLKQYMYYEDGDELGTGYECFSYFSFKLSNLETITFYSQELNFCEGGGLD